MYIGREMITTASIDLRTRERKREKMAASIGRARACQDC